jgi:hypothetical protein
MEEALFDWLFFDTIERIVVLGGGGGGGDV